MFTNRRFFRSMAVFLLLNTLYATFLPSLSYALTSGPNQPEFTSFESPGTTDMVSLATGDFTYNMPLLEVPGPEGGFSLPLSYHAGVGLDQQASWVGLGWNMNPGAIARNLVNFPDDANGELNETLVNDPGISGVRRSYFGIVNQDWNSETGYHGAVDILGLVSVGWDGKGLSGGDVIGIGGGNVYGVQQGGGAHFNPVRFGMGVVTIASFGAGSAFSSVGSAAAAIGKEIAIGVAMNSAITAIRMGSSLSAGFANPSTWEDAGFFTTEYRQFIHESRKEAMYGSLYYHNAGLDPSSYLEALSPDVYKGSYANPAYKPTAFRNTYEVSDQGNQDSDVSTDMYLYAYPGENYSKVNENRPISIAHDNFSVMGSGVSGSIHPYRTETGSLALAKRVDDNHIKYNLVPFLEYKVGFRYQNSISNGYDYHKGQAPTGAYTLGIDKDWQNPNGRRLLFTDPSLYSTTSRTENENNRLGLKDKRLAEGKHIEWFTNAQLGYPSTVPQGIGAFVITGEDGTTYHYRLPVHNFKQFSKGFNKNDINKFSWQRMGDYATHWLLTGITGSDYVDRAPLGSIGEEDWGYWVKLDYGKFASQYKWRIPYAGYSYSDDATEPADKAYSYFSEGYRETYYLNSIATRTHTALFIKDVREDGRGHYSNVNAFNANLNFGVNPTFNDQNASSSLKLSEIILLNNQDYKQITTQMSPAFGVNTNNNAATNNNLLRNGDSFANVFDSYDVQANAAIRTYVNDKALKRIVLNYSYELAPGTFNSFAFPTSGTPLPTLDDQNPVSNSTGRNGKLTLRSLSVYGLQNTKLMPDFLFEYGNNPAYHPDRWDAWGLYNSTGANNATSHRASAQDQDGAAWSLTKVTSPLGGTTEIKYERDVYSLVSGYNTTSNVSVNATIPPIAMPSFTFDVTYAGNLADAIPIGSMVQFAGYITNEYTCPGGVVPPIEGASFNDNYRVINVTSNSITLENPPRAQPLGSYQNGCTFLKSTLVGQMAIPSNVKGGDLRVSAIQTVDENGTPYKTRYLYSKYETGGSISSGVISKEPTFAKNNGQYPCYEWFDYPFTPVLYGKVTVLNGKLGTDADYSQKDEFAFTTPSPAMVTNASTIVSGGLAQNPIRASRSYEELIMATHNVQVKTASLGQIQSIQRFNRRGTLEQRTTFGYSSQVPNSTGKLQGFYTEGTLTTDLVYYFNGIPQDYWPFRYIIKNTIKQFIPSVLTSVKTESSSLSSTTSNTAFDFLTGQVLQKENVNSLGIKYRSVQVPAYTLAPYASMGSKNDDPANRNMLLQPAASFLYKVDNAGSNLISAAIQTWKSDWGTYRAYNGSTYANETINPAQAIWRKHQSYVWNATALNTDGTWKNFVNYDWAVNAVLDPRWLKTGEVLQYDHYSQPLMSQDVNGNYAAKKRGYGQTQTTVSVDNARYTEIAYSGAEDKVAAGSGFHFGGEVTGGESQNATYAHTGAYSLRLGGGTRGFLYSAIANTEVETSRTYHASVWIHSSDLAGKNGRLFAEVAPAGGGAATLLKEISLSDPSVKQAGNWYLVDLIFDLPATHNGKILTVGCRNASGTGTVYAYFDDFRFHPLDAPLSTYVYDARTNQVTHVLDGDNLYTRYVYDAAGNVVKTYRETLGMASNEKLISDRSYHYARRMN